MIVFASAVIRIARAIPKNEITRHVCGQIVRSATSVGANYEEARGAESRADFIHKLGIATKELRETIYWLEVIASSHMTASDVSGLVQEASELCAILGASIKTAKKRAG